MKTRKKNKANSTIPPYQQLIDRFEASETALKAAQRETQDAPLNARNVRETIELLGILESIHAYLTACHSDAEAKMTMPSDFNCKIEDLPKMLKKEYKKSDTLKKMFTDENEYNSFREYYFAYQGLTLEIEKAYTKLSLVLPKKQKNEDQLDNDADNQTNTPPDVWLSGVLTVLGQSENEQDDNNQTNAQLNLWLNETLAQFAADQFDTQKGCCIASPESDLISTLRSDEDDIATKQTAIEDYLETNKNDKSGLLRNILFSLKNAELSINHSNHWVADDDKAQRIARLFQTRSCATFFNVFTPKSTLKTVAFLGSDASLEDKQTVVDYTLRRGDNSDLVKILDLQKNIQPKPGAAKRPQKK